jgi:hypothetical protein
MNYLTTTTTEVRFTHSSYPAGTQVRVTSPIVEGLVNVRFEDGRETVLSPHRLATPPDRFYEGLEKAGLR